MASNNDTEPRGWQVGKSLAECLRHMLDNHVACDVTFAVQSTGNPHIKITAHKLILQARSPIFETMFSGASVEAGGDVVITDMNPEPFQDLLRYIYTDDINLDGDNVIPLLYAGEKYILENLTKKCKEFLEKEISVDNACSILTHSMIQQDEELVNKCLDLIAPNVKAVVKTESFYTMSHEALLKVVGYDHLAHGVEAELFEACIEWGTRRTKDPDNAKDEDVRGILGTECLHKIRFPYIPFKEFGAKFGQTSVLTADEKCAIYSLLASQEECNSKALSALGFDVSSRMMRAARYKHDSGFAYTCDLLSEEKSREAFTFTVNKPIQLRGLSFHGGRKGLEFEVKITILTKSALDESGPLVETEQTITAKENYEPIPVYFRKFPVHIDTKYKVTTHVRSTCKTSCSSDPVEIIVKGDMIISNSLIKTPLRTRDGKAAGFVAELLFQRLPGGT